MPDSAKYLIHAAIAADGVVERTDVVGAVYGQTEGLLGEELDLRRLQESSKLGRIDVQIETNNGQSVGELTVATSLDRVETATLAAALETIDRVGPCRATIEVTDLEDVRAAKRREVIDRAETLLVEEFEETTSEAIVDEVRQRVATADVTTYEGLPAGPRVPDADAVVVVEGRADVQAVLAAGVKNAVAVEGTDVPETVAELTADRTTTAFLDGDRGGELILRELRQVGDVDAVAFAPPDRSVEDLSRSEVLAALRSKVTVDDVEDAASARDLADASRARTSGGVVPEDPDDAAIDARSPASDVDEVTERDAAEAGATSGAESGATNGAEPDAADATESGATDAAGDAADAPGSDEAGDGSTGDAAADDVSTAGAATTARSPSDEADPGDAVSEAGPTASESAEPTPETATAADAAVGTAEDAAEPERGATSAGEAAADATAGPQTLRGHVESVLGTDRVRLLDEDGTELTTAPSDQAFEALDACDAAPTAVVLDGALDQRLLDLAAQRGVRDVVAASLGSFTKRPTDVRIRTAEQLLAD